MSSNLRDTLSSAGAFGQRLRALREQAGFTQRRLAERAGLHPQGIVKLERGEREPAWTTVLALAEALGVTCLAFLLPKQGPHRLPTANMEPTKRKHRRHKKGK